MSAAPRESSDIGVAKLCGCVGYALRRARKLLPSGPRQACVEECLVAALQLLEEQVHRPVVPPVVRKGGLAKFVRLAARPTPAGGAQPTVAEAAGGDEESHAQEAKLEASLSGGGGVLRVSRPHRPGGHPTSSGETHKVCEGGGTPSETPSFGCAEDRIPKKEEAGIVHITSAEQSEEVEPHLDDIAVACRRWCGPNWQSALKEVKEVQTQAEAVEQDAQLAARSVAAFGGVALFGCADEHRAVPLLLSAKEAERRQMKAQRVAPSEARFCPP